MEARPARCTRLRPGPSRAARRTRGELRSFATSSGWHSEWRTKAVVLPPASTANARAEPTSTRANVEAGASQRRASEGEPNNAQLLFPAPAGASKLWSGVGTPFMAHFIQMCAFNCSPFLSSGHNSNFEHLLSLCLQQ